jgi:lysyl-tRNA synthetase class II
VDKAIICQRVATKLFAAENAIDAAIQRASEVLTDFIEARGEIGFSAVLGTEAVSKISQSVTALSEGRRAMVEAHHELNDVKLRLGVRTKMFGTGPKGYAGDIPEETVVERRRAS